MERHALPAPASPPPSLWPSPARFVSITGPSRVTYGTLEERGKDGPGSRAVCLRKCPRKSYKLKKHAVRRVDIYSWGMYFEVCTALHDVGTRYDYLLRRSMSHPQAGWIKMIAKGHAQAWNERARDLIMRSRSPYHSVYRHVSACVPVSLPCRPTF